MKLFFTFVVFAVMFVNADTDNPCASYKEDGYESVVCVCNQTYCDTVIRETPSDDQYVAYTTSKAGLRFSKSYGILEENDDTSISGATARLELKLDSLHQTIIGFGGAVTDSASINWKSLSEELQAHMVNSYFSSAGLQYNMLRVPIGGTDFSTRPYAYNELPINDFKLSNFSLAPEDNQYKIPLIKAAMQTSDCPIYMIGTVWSPPVWMKTNNAWHGFSRLKEEFYPTYVDYHIKFLDLYAAAGITAWAISTTNEPLNGVLDLTRFNSLGWTMARMANYIINYLGPTIRNSTHKHVKILVNDDQRLMIPYYFNSMVLKYPESLKYIDGVAVHYYVDAFFPATVLSDVSMFYPDKFVIATEACEGSLPWEEHGVILGSWTRAVNYINDIMTDLNYNVVGWIDWNLALDTNGGPNWASNFVDSAVVVLAKQRFVKQPIFYIMGHFSKFIPRGSQRIEVKESKCIFHSSFQNVAFLTPSNTIVLVIFNQKKANAVKIIINKKKIILRLDENSITTVEFKSPEV
ncbi:hypothetical protein K1T71_011154 [Dendrolimus kikuchii]|uniref:Uncharacterized protein n=1 Tax=Dendrolimus kikuchii TaxID=765133 RepID=A0ACC1CN64_9NEOP|nr:hypothetical protein K1T71_011154 [Dendrolimus kikuchii]